MSTSLSTHSPRSHGAATFPASLIPVTLICGVLSVAVALRYVHAGWRSAVLLFAGVVGVAVLLALAVRRFELFVLLLLVLRPAADWFRSGSVSGSGQIASGVSAIFLFAAAVWLIGRLGWAERRRQTPLAWALGFMTLACFASVWGSQDPTTSLMEAARFLSAAAMYLVLERLITTEAGVRRTLAACYLSALVPITVGLVHAVTGAEAAGSDGLARLQATFAHPNAYGYYLAVLSIMAVAVLPHTRSRMRVGLLAILAFCLGELLLTYSRGSWLALLTGLVIVALLQSRRLLVVLAVALVVVPLAVPSVTSRVSDLDDERTLRGTGGNSFIWRVDHWRETMTLADDQPFTGIGLRMATQLSAGRNAPHNDYVRTYVELGLLGLTAYLVLLLVLLRTAQSALRRARHGLPRGVAVGFTACAVSFCLVSVGTNRITSVVELWYLFAFAAAAAAVARLPDGEVGAR